MFCKKPDSVNEGVDDRARLCQDERDEAVPVADELAVAGHLEQRDKGERSPSGNPDDDDDQ